MIITKLDKLVVYDSGRILFETDRNIFELGRLEDGKFSSFEKILKWDIPGDMRNARKQNLNRRDNYFLNYKDSIGWSRVALYVHASNIAVKDLGEFLDFEQHGEKCYLHYFILTLKSPGSITYRQNHAEKMLVPGDWRLPAGAKWDRDYKVISTEARELNKKRCLAKGIQYEDYNIVHRWSTEETTNTVVFKSPTYTRIEKSPERIEREKIADLMSSVIWGNKTISHYEVEDLLRVFNISIK